MRQRMLGRTGYMLSEVSFGTIPILSGNVEVLPRYTSPELPEALEIMEQAFALGCNLFDTAIVPEYGDAEYKLGAFWKRHPGEIVIADKARAYTGEAMERALGQSLRNLDRDFCELYFVHQAAPENEAQVFGRGGALDVLAEWKKSGRIGAVGVASHHLSVLARAARDPRVDVIQASGNLLERGMLDRMEEQPSVFARVGILVNKVYAAGELPAFFAPAEMIGHALSYGVSSALVGCGSRAEVQAAMAAEPVPRRMPWEEALSRLQRQKSILPCDRCQKCACPRGLEVAAILRYANYHTLNHKKWAEERLNACAPRIVSQCGGCGECAAVCPRGIDIRRELTRLTEENTL